MTPEEVKVITGRPPDELALYCDDSVFLLTLLGLVHNRGRMVGVADMAEAYNKMLLESGEARLGGS